jgi:small subunit ribosomal protein S21
MLIVKVQKDNLNRALKQFKRKFRDTQVLKEIRERKNYTKKSLKRKIEKENAIRKLKKQQDDE